MRSVLDALSSELEVILHYFVFHFKDAETEFQRHWFEQCHTASQSVVGAVHFVLYYGYLIAKMYQKRKWLSAYV